VLFPELCTPTATFTTTGSPPPKHTTGLTMPRRTTTRTQARHQRITDERQHNQALLDNPETPENDCDDAHLPSRPQHPGDDDDPPPF
jgi:hypothetical protein